MKFTLKLTAPKSDTDDQAIRRLRAWLKGAGRAYGLRCTRCEQDEPQTEIGRQTATQSVRDDAERLPEITCIAFHTEEVNST